MASFSTSSREMLSTCHDDLISIFSTVIVDYDCKILEGHRSMERQKELFRTGSSETLGSKHLSLPSVAIDVSPYPIPKNWGADNPKDMAEFYFFAGYVKGIAKSMGITLRWGGDWDGDKSFTDQTFDDLVHFEVVE